MRPFPVSQFLRGEFATVVSKQLCCSSQQDSASTDLESIIVAYEWADDDCHWLAWWAETQTVWAWEIFCHDIHYLEKSRVLVLKYLCIWFVGITLTKVPLLFTYSHTHISINYMFQLFHSPLSFRSLEIFRKCQHLILFYGLMLVQIFAKKLDGLNSSFTEQEIFE